MSCLHYEGDQLYVENVSLQDVAKQYGTPCYVYSRAALEANWRAFDEAFRRTPHRICYAVKANGNVHILRLLAQLNSGYDIVSQGELERVLLAGGDPKKVIFSGVGKKQIEIERAIEKGIYCFDVESEPELERLHHIASSRHTRVNIALRVNPHVDARTHSHIATGLNVNKFGIEASDIMPLCQKIASLPSLQLIGLASHIGSQIVELSPFLAMLDCLLDLYKQVKTLGIKLQHINIGGGLGITYKDEKPPSIADYAKALQTKLADFPLEVILEPGRSIVGNAGILLTQVEYIKLTSQKQFALVDAGMNDLLRPALYDAWQPILPVKKRAEPAFIYDIAGPVCESADFLGKDRLLAIQAGDLLAVDSAGAYGFSMSSNYNARCRAAEILIDRDEMKIIRRRESFTDLFAAENLT
jgi:diaminopimelate decarboxylase